jgi:hypothetical protein
MRLREDLLSYSAPLIICIALVTGFIGGAAAWAAVADLIAHAGDDDIDLTFAMFDGRSIVVGLVVGLITVLVTGSLLGWAWSVVLRRLSPR